MCQLKYGPLVYTYVHSSMIKTIKRVFLFGRDVIFKACFSMWIRILDKDIQVFVTIFEF